MNTIKKTTLALLAAAATLTAGAQTLTDLYTYTQVDGGYRVSLTSNFKAQVNKAQGGSFTSGSYTWHTGDPLPNPGSTHNGQPVVSMNSTFYEYWYAPSLDLSQWNTSNVTDMASMFYDCTALETVNLSSFNTARVTTMAQMFGYCPSLTSLDLKGFNTSSVRDMSAMFTDCIKLASIDLSSFNTASVTTMKSMFDYCSSLSSLDLSGFNTSNVTDMSSMFKSCRSLTRLDIYNFTVDSSPLTESMFNGCGKAARAYVKEAATVDYLANATNTGINTANLAIIYDPGYYTYTAIDGGYKVGLTDAFKAQVNATSGEYDHRGDVWATGMPLPAPDTIHDGQPVVSMNRMFYTLNRIPMLDLSLWRTPYVTDIEYMFAHCDSLTTLYMPGFTTSQVTNMDAAFANSSKFRYIDITGFSFESATKYLSMFYDCGRAIDGDLCKVYVGSPEAYDFVTTTRSLDAESHRLEFVYWPDFYSYTELDDNSGYRATIASEFLEQVAKPQGGRYSHGGKVWHTSDPLPAPSVTVEGKRMVSLESMFRGITTIDSLVLDCSQWDMTGVSSIKSMFAHCNSLASLTINGLNTSAVTNMDSVFRSCNSLKQLEGPQQWNTRNVTSMKGTFAGCSALDSLDLSQWRCTQVQNMTYLFSYCSSLLYLDISGFNPTSSINMYNIFNDCGVRKGPFSTKALTNVYVKNTNAHTIFSGSTTGYRPHYITFVIRDNSEGITGDINDDEIVDITDVNLAINMVLGKTDTTDAGDVNDDGQVDITDVNTIINIMLGK